MVGAALRALKEFLWKSPFESSQNEVITIYEPDGTQIEATILEELANGSYMIRYVKKGADGYDEAHVEVVFPDNLKVRGQRPRPKRTRLRKPSARKVLQSM